MGRKVNMEKLMAKIAAVTQQDANELKQQAEETKVKTTAEEEVYHKQSVINFFTTYVAPQKPVQKQGESKIAFAKRVAEYESKRNSWRFKTCKACGLDFVYDYTFDGVAHCSNECLDATLREIGLQLTVGRDLKQRWSTTAHPAIVPANALEVLKKLYPESFEATSQSPSEPSSSEHDALVP